MNGGTLLATSRLIRGSAVTKAAAISVPWSCGGSQNKSSHSCRDNCCSFSDSVTDSVVFGKDDPAALADFKKPIFVFSVRSKVVVVDLDGLADLPQRLSDDLPTERTVDEEN